MPTATQHKNQIQHNKKLLQEELFDYRNSKYFDWAVTICYYCVLHLVDSKLADLGHIEVGEHKDRRYLIREELETYYPGVYLLYKDIEQRSRRSRYYCLNITKLEVNYALESMKKIERMLSA